MQIKQLDSYFKTSYPHHKALQQIAAALLKNGDELRIVGGALRNILLDKAVDDVDLATKHSPDQVIKLLEAAKIKWVDVGVQYGTVGAVLGGKLFEITSLRQDIQTDGRHAQVEFCEDFLLDAQRRDFTINAMSLDFSGEFYDYFNGLEDLKSGIVKFIGQAPERIKEDFLRIIRFFRFFCYYGKDIHDEAAFEACAQYAQNLQTLSCERIHLEMSKILLCDIERLEIGLNLMQKAGILPHIFGCREFDFEKFANFKQIAQKKINNEFLLRLTLLIKAGADFDFILKNWNLSKKETQYLKNLLEIDFELIDPEFTLIKRRMLEYDKDFLCDALLVSFIQIPVADQYYDKFNNFIINYEIPIFPLTGQDLIDVGFQSGPYLGKALKKAKEAWIKSDYCKNKEQLVQFCRKSPREVMKYEVEFAVRDKIWEKDLKKISFWINKATRITLQALREKYKFSQELGFHLSVCLSNDREIKKLNANYRDKEKPTNILSFPLYGNILDVLDNKTGIVYNEKKHVMLGDIIISYETLLSELSPQKTFREHLTHLIIHSILHLFNYDHQNDDEAKIMEGFEVEILNKLNIPNPYI